MKELWERGMVTDTELCQDHVHLMLAVAAGSKKQKPTTAVQHTGTQHTQVSLHFLEHQLASFWLNVPKTECDLERGWYY